jgi:hypothetical protein
VENLNLKQINNGENMKERWRKIGMMARILCGSA